MSIKIYITESQKKALILEKQNEQIGETLKNNENFAKEVLQNTTKQTGIDFKFLFTWGAGIGGFMEPVSDFMRGEFPTLDTASSSLLLTAVFCTIFLENYEVTKKLLVAVKEKNLKTEFTTTFKKASELKTTFVQFLESLGISMSKLVNMLSYTFIIPILSILIDFSQSGEMNWSDIKEIAIRLSSFGVITLSSKAISVFLRKLFVRFSNLN